MHSDIRGFAVRSLLRNGIGHTASKCLYCMELASRLGLSRAISNGITVGGTRRMTSTHRHSAKITNSPPRRLAGVVVGFDRNEMVIHPERVDPC